MRKRSSHLPAYPSRAFPSPPHAVGKTSKAANGRTETNWRDVTVWRQENLANYLTKGKQVYVEGRLQTRSYDDKDGKKVYATDVIAEDILLLGGRGDAGPAEEGSGMASAPAPRPSAQGRLHRLRMSLPRWVLRTTTFRSSSADGQCARFVEL